MFRNFCKSGHDVILFEIQLSVLSDYNHPTTRIITVRVVGLLSMNDFMILWLLEQNQESELE